MEGVLGFGGSLKFWRESKVLEESQAGKESKYSGVELQCFCRDSRFGRIPRLRSGFYGVCGIPWFRRDIIEGWKESFKGFTGTPGFRRDLKVKRDPRLWPEGSQGLAGGITGFLGIPEGS